MKRIDNDTWWRTGNVEVPMALKWFEAIELSVFLVTNMEIQDGVS